MAMIASDIQYTQSKPRPKYRLYDTTVYHLEPVHKFTVSGMARLAIGDPPLVIHRFFNIEEKGKFLKDIVKDPDLIWSTDPMTHNTHLTITAYIKPEDYIMYLLKFGVR